jgi:hypothetical protein
MADQMPPEDTIAAHAGIALSQVILQVLIETRLVSIPDVQAKLREAAKANRTAGPANKAVAQLFETMATELGRRPAPTPPN